MDCKCKYCGEIFKQNVHGRKKQYCSKPECIKAAKNETQRKWYAKKMDKLEGAKIKIIEQKDPKKNVIYSNNVKPKYINPTNYENFHDIIEIAKEFGTVKFQLDEKMKKTQAEQSFYDKCDQDLLHKLEDLDDEAADLEEQIVKLVKEYIPIRKQRRVVKDRLLLLQGLSMGMRNNPNEYVFSTIKGFEKQRYYNSNKEKKE